MTQAHKISQRAPSGDRPAGPKVDAVFLLAGGVRQTALVKGTRRSPALLPLTRERRLIDHWFDELAGAFGNAETIPPVEVVGPWSEEADLGKTGIRFRPDPAEYRGTAGLLHDLTMELPADARILVANVGQVLHEPLSQIINALKRAGGDLATVSNTNGRPTMMLLTKCRVFHGISPVGFVDLKEQALPGIAEKNDIRVVHWPGSFGMNLRTRSEYIDTLRCLHAQGISGDPFREDWHSRFSLVEQQADVAPSARLHDSVVLAGGKVAAGASVIRSVIGPGGTVREGEAVADVVVGPVGHIREQIS